MAAGLLRFGFPWDVQRGAFFSNFTLNGTTDQLEAVFMAREAATITRLGVRVGTVTGTSPAYKISLQGVDAGSANGFPDGVIKGGGSPASAVFTPTVGQNGTWQWYTLDNPYTCAAGEMLSLVIAYSSGTIDGSNNTSFSHNDDTMGVGSLRFPYMILNDAGARSYQSTPSPVFAYGSSSTCWGYPKQATYSLTPTLTSSPDEIALRFKLPAGWGSTYRVRAVRLPITLDNNTTLRIQLYDGTTVLQNVTYDTDLKTGTTTGLVEVPFDETTLADLAHGSEYRIGFRPDGAIGLTFHGFTVGAAGDLDAYPLQQEFYLSTRTDDGAWTDTTTTRPFVELTLTDVTEPAAGAPVQAPYFECTDAGYAA